MSDKSFQELRSRSLFARLKRLFSNDVIVRNVGGKKLKVIDTDEIQYATDRNSLRDRFNRLRTTSYNQYTRDFNLSDPPTSKEVKELQKYVRQEIANVAGEVSKPGLADHVVGTSKTFRSLARIAGAAPSSEGPRERRFLWDTDLREITDEIVTTYSFRIGNESGLCQPGNGSHHHSILAFNGR